MNDVLKIGKKALTYGVVVTTILWTMGAAALVAPLVASAQTTVALSAGDVIKGASTKNVFVYGSDGRRYTFPNDKVFLSWFKDYKAVKTVSDAQLGSIQIGGTVAYRPGTYLVKIQTDPKVYAVEPGGTLRWVETEAIASALWGPKWNKMVHDVDPTIFPYVYKVGASLSSAMYPSGSLVRLGTDVWHIVGTERHKVTAAGLAANRFDNKFVLTATDLSAYTEGPMIDGYAAKFSDASQLAVAAPVAPVVPVVPGAPTPPAAVGTGLTVALAADNPAAATIVTDTGSNGAQALIPALKLNFTASADGDVKVTSLTLKRGGISADTDLSNVYLFDDGKLVSNPTIAANKITWTSGSGLFTVAKGTTKSINVKFDMKNLSSTGKTYIFSLESASAVVAGGAAVNGTFPITGNTYTLAGVTDLGKLTITTVSPAAASTVDPGTLGHEIWRIQVAVLNQDVEIRKLILTVVGSVSTGDLKNFALFDGATQVGATVMDMAADKTVVIEPTTPYVLKTGVTKNLSLRADVVGGTNRTFRATIQDGTHVVIYDRGYNIFLKHAGSDSFTVIEPTSSVNWTVNTGRLNLSVANDSPVGNIASSTTNVTLSKFVFEAVGEDMKVANLTMDCTAVPTTLKLANLKMVLNGVQVGTTVTTLLCDGTDSAQTFGNTFIVKSGQKAVLSLVADTTHATVSAGNTVHADLVVGSSNASGVISLSSISTTAQTGRTLTVRGNTVSVARNASFGDKTSDNPSGTVNASNLRVASFVITAGTGEDVDVTQVALTETASTCIGTYLQNVRLVNSAGTQIAPTLASPSSSCGTANSYTFNVSPTITIPAGSDYVVDVFADSKSTALTTASTRLITVDSVTASGRNTGTSASSGTDVLLQFVYTAAAGGFAVAVDADTPVANNQLMGATGVTLAKFKLTASSTEAVNITQIVLLNKVSSAATGTLANIKLIDDSSGTQIGNTLPAFGISNGTSTFTYGTFASLNYTVPKNTIKVIKVVADITSYEAGGYTTTGQTFSLALSGNYSSGSNSFTAQGAGSGVTLTATITGSPDGGQYLAQAATSTLYRGKLSVAYAGDTPSGASSPSASQVVMKFVVTNLANAGGYSAIIKSVNFDLSTTISNTTSRVLTVYKDSLSTTALLSTSFLANQNFGDTRVTDAGFTDVDISSGSSKTFWVTLDTTDAASLKSLALRVGADDISWTDGITTNTTSGNDLPLLYKTFTY